MRFLALLLALAVSGPATAQDLVKGGIKISQPWARATPGGAKVAAGYLTITNTGKAPDRLVGGSFTAAGTLEIHDMTMTDGVMRMRRVDGGLELKPGETIALKPGSLHMMFMDLKQPLKQGERIKGTLVFEKAGTIEIVYGVAPIGAAGPDSHTDGSKPADGDTQHHKHH